MACNTCSCTDACGHAGRRPIENVAFMREISAIIGTLDSNLFVDFVLGLPMLGWALHAPTQMRRDREPEETVQDLLSRSHAQNQKLISRTRAFSDEQLDWEAWQKTMEEVEMGILSPPASSIADLGLEAVLPGAEAWPMGATWLSSCSDSAGLR